MEPSPPVPELPPAPAAGFASDNVAGAHPLVLEALLRANGGHATAYGEDPWSARVAGAFEDLFGSPVTTALVYGGTGANVVALQCLLERPYQAVVCPESAHVATDECGAPERFTGSRLLTVPAPGGKLRPEDVTATLPMLGDRHHVQPAVVSITQSTELGTVYTPDEVAQLCDTAHRHGMRVHLDGARIGNAAAALGCDVRAFTTDAGVDALTFGGTKNGLLYGEAVVLFDPRAATALPFVQKQAGQLPSKTRFVAAQFEALLADGLWLRTAADANARARRLARGAAAVPGVQVREPQVNAVFARLPRPVLEELQRWSFFWTWDEATSLARWMCAFDTRDEDVDAFVAGLAAVAARHPEAVAAAG